MSPNPSFTIGDALNILIVDDSNTSRILLQTILTNSGYGEVLCAESARDSFRLLESLVDESGRSMVDLILMDILMPDMDGIAATRTIKADARYQDIPIIMVTVKDETESLERAFDAGAIDYISKPVDKVELRARVRSILRLKQETDRRRARECEKEKLIEELREALAKVRTLSGLLPICASCKMIRDDKGYWKQIESYIRANSDAEFTHSICPDCAKKLYPEIYKKRFHEDGSLREEE